jgi:hypothetical protein
VPPSCARGYGVVQGIPFTSGRACFAGLYVGGGDPRSYRSIDPLETKGSANYAANSLPGKNGFLGGATAANQVTATAQYLYSLFWSGQPDGSGDGEWCVYWYATTTLNNAVSGNVALRACESLAAACQHVQTRSQVLHAGGSAGCSGSGQLWQGCTCPPMQTGPLGHVSSQSIIHVSVLNAPCREGYLLWFPLQGLTLITLKL